MTRVVLFDIDGTLIRTGGAGVRAFERTFATVFGIPGASENMSFAGRTDWGLVREVFRRFEIEESRSNFGRFFESYLLLLQQFLQELQGEPCPAAAEVVARFANLPDPPVLGLLTGNIRRGAEIKLRHYNLWEPVQSGAFAFGDDHECRNHLAAIAKERSEQVVGRKLEGREILIIGDTPLDIECARAIQADVLAVATGGYNVAQLEAHNPTWVAESLKEIDPGELCSRKPAAVR